jgi:hypothetical protein
MLWNGNECGKTKVMRISRHPFQIQIVIDQKQPKNVEYFNYLSSIITNYTNEHGKLNPRLPWQKQLSARRLFSPANWM